jgi:hypothetical protein
MGNKVLFVVALWAPILGLVACTHNAKNEADTEKEKPMKFLIGDGNVRIEESVPLPQADRKTAQYFVSQVDTAKFVESQTSLPGYPWADESSEFTLSGELDDEKECEINISHFKRKKAPASLEDPRYLIKVTVKDGMKDGPFESIINGENEGEILLGQYPVTSFESKEEIVVNETVIPYWVYDPETHNYEIVKKMGDRRYLKKVLTFDPYLKEVKNVKYEILSDIGGQMVDQMSVLARFQCGA